MNTPTLHFKATCRRQRGSILAKILIGIPAALITIAIGWYSFATLRLQYWDNKVREMCEKEEGLRVFEKIYLSNHEYQSLIGLSGEIAVRLEQPYSLMPFFINLNKSIIHDGKPEVVRLEQQLIQRKNNKIIATLTTYSRIGGDPGFVDNPSTFSCPVVHENWFTNVIYRKGE